jgi:AcrR family transcriptional regulator
MFTFTGHETNTARHRLSVIEQAARDCSESEDHVAGRANDRRVQRTQQLLHGALLALIQEKGFEQLSVQDIIDRANVGRATFYAHFDNKEDLLASGIDGLRASLEERRRRALSESMSDDERLFAFSHEMFVHANEHRNVFQAMVGKRSGAVIQQLLHKMLLDLIRDEVKATTVRRNTDVIPAEAVAQFVAGGIFGLLVWWSNGKMRMPVEEVNTLFRRLAIPAVKAAALH